MAPWQVELYIIPKTSLATAPSPLPIDMLETVAWWAGAALPPDYRARFNAMTAPSQSPSPDVETWGAEDSNRIDVRLADGRVIRVRARIDVRRPDAKFAAGLITFARVAGAALVRVDGAAIEPTAGGFGPVEQDAAISALRMTSRAQMPLSFIYMPPGRAF
jgi:hypothetical protein